MNRRDRRVAARKPQTAFKDADAGNPAALSEAGLRHLRAGRHLEAQICCQQALALDGDHADTLHLMGLLSLHERQTDHAMEWIVRAIRQDPKPEYLASLGTVLQQQGKHEEAIKAFDKAVQLRPDDAGLWTRLGNILLELQRYDHALLSLQHILKLDPNRQDAAYKSGVLLHQFGRFEEALAHFDRCDALLPNHAPTLQGRVRALFSLKRYQEALAGSQRVYELDPVNADICNYIGSCLQLLGQEQEALRWFDKALVHSPDAIEILNNKASILGQLQRFDEAFAFYHHIRTVHPDDPTTDWNLALLQMLTGDFEAGWAGRESRWTKAEPFPYPKFSQPVWLGGESIDGKTILIHVDEGLGDTLQFARYVPMVAARGARVILVVERPLHPLLSGLSGVSQCLAYGSGPLPAFDMHCPMGSLPLVFGTRLDTIPATTSYLPSAAEARVRAWEQRLDQSLARMTGYGSAWCGPEASATGTISIDRRRS
jgi:tetratricopeptide (TPR) repeat protein